MSSDTYNLVSVVLLALTVVAGIATVAVYYHQLRVMQQSLLTMQDTLKAQVVQSRKQNTFELNKQFQELLPARTAAACILENNRLSLKELHRTLPSDQFYQLSAVLHFFDNIQFLKELNMIDEQVASGLFGSYFAYFNQYFHVLFDGQNAEWSSLARRISDLAIWLDGDNAGEPPASLSWVNELTSA